MSQNVHFSSATNEWATPQDFFDKLNTQFDFNLDPCATAENAKCKSFSLLKIMAWNRIGVNTAYFAIRHMAAD